MSVESLYNLQIVHYVPCVHRGISSTCTLYIVEVDVRLSSFDGKREKKNIFSHFNEIFSMLQSIVAAFYCRSVIVIVVVIVVALLLVVDTVLLMFLYSLLILLRCAFLFHFILLFFSPLLLFASLVRFSIFLSCAALHNNKTIFFSSLYRLRQIHFVYLRIHIECSIYAGVRMYGSGASISF